MHYYFASTYGSGDYSTTTYNGASTTTSTSSTSTLADTGFPVLAVSGLALVVIVLAIIISVLKRRKHPTVSQPVGSKNGSNTYGKGSF